MACEEEVAAVGAPARAELDEPVGAAHDVEAVLDEDEGVAGVGHIVEELHEALYVVEVEAVGGLVDDVDFAAAVQVVGEFDALQFAAAEGGHALVEV